MSTVGFAFKDLKRRSFQTALVIAALSLCVTVMVSTVLIAYNLDVAIPIFATGTLSGSFVNIFRGFAIVTAYLSILAGAVMAYFFVSANMSQRTRDIGIAKAIGCSRNQVLGSFTTQLFLMILISCIAGTGAGISLTYFFVFLNQANLPSSNLLINSWSIFIILTVFSVVTFLFGRRPLVKACDARPLETLFPYYLRGVSYRSAKSPTTRLGLSFRMVYRTLLRRKAATISTIICLSIILGTATVATAGTAIANQTTQSYFRRGVGENVIVIGHTDVVDQYVSFLSTFHQTQEKNTFNYLDSRYIISDLTISELSNITGIIRTDARLFFETTVFERQTIQIMDEQLVMIGDQRSASAVVFGLDSKQAVNDWYISGRNLNDADQYSAILGDSLASNILSSPFVQKVKILDKDFNVVGVSSDPLNLGFVAYLPLKTVFGVVNQTGHNLILLKVDPKLRTQVLQNVRKSLEGTGLQLAELNPLIDRFSSFSQSIWLSFTILSLFFLATAALCLFTHMTLRIMEQESEFGIIRALGAKPRKAVAIIWMQAIFIALISGAIGITIGLSISFAFLIPEPVISMNDVVTITAWSLLAIGFLCVSSLHPALRMQKKPITRLISH